MPAAVPGLVAVVAAVAAFTDSAAAHSAVPAPAAAPVVLIDGPSGAGKSTLADALVAAWPGATPPTLVRMDDLYPGWDGLGAGARNVHDALLLPRSQGEVAGWRRYDWAAEAPGDWIQVDPERPLVVEGCGALLRANMPVSDVRVWITADDAVRKPRALARDKGSFDAHWDRWQRQFDAFLAAEYPLDIATIVLDGTGGESGEADARGGEPGRPDYRGAMSDSAHTPKEYIVEYVDGPLEGQTDRRLLIDGKYDEQVTALVNVQGIDTTLWYRALGSRMVVDQQQVRYRFERSESDPVQEDRDDGSMQISPVI